MTKFTLASLYKGAADYTYWMYGINGMTQHRAAHRGRALELHSVHDEKTAHRLAQEFNLQMETESANEYSTILERHGMEMLSQVWKPFKPVQRVIFSVPGFGLRASELP